MKLHSPDIKAGSTVPMLHVHGSAGGQNVSPALEWTIHRPARAGSP